MNTFLESIKKFRVLWIFVIIVLILSVVAKGSYDSRQNLAYADSLDKVLATVEGKEITLRDFAVYVAFHEAQVQEQALIYDDEDTKKYWNSNLNGEFVRFAARDTAVEMVIHDELFYQLSQELQIDLSEKELAILENDVEDFWSDLVDEGKDEKLGISREDVYNSYYKIALAEKAQAIYAAMNSVEYQDYNYGEEEFLSFLENYEYTIEKGVVEKLNFGYITLEH